MKRTIAIGAALAAVIFALAFSPAAEIKTEGGNPTAPAAIPVPAGTAAPSPTPAKSSARGGEFEVRIAPAAADDIAVIRQGQIFLIEVFEESGTAASVRVEWAGRVIPCAPYWGRRLWQGLAAAGVDQEPGESLLRVRMESTLGEEWEKGVVFRVEKVEWPRERLRVQTDKVQFSAEARARIAEEGLAFKKAWDGAAIPSLRQGPFLRPTPGGITALFGNRRVYNSGKLKSIHNGVDLEAAVGDPILATAAGRVVLVRDCYVEGGTVVIDHGGDVFTYYCHLSGFAVEEGMMIEQGAVIGLAGATGRVTGPHLHWSARLQGVKADPLSLFALEPWLAIPEMENPTYLAYLERIQKINAREPGSQEE